jgi:hypothetical protein
LNSSVIKIKKDKPKLRKTKKVKKIKKKSEKKAHKTIKKHIEKHSSSNQNANEPKTTKSDMKVADSSSVSVSCSKVQKNWSYRWVRVPNVFEFYEDNWLRRWIRREVKSD